VFEQLINTHGTLVLNAQEIDQSEAKMPLKMYSNLLMNDF